MVKKILSTGVFLVLVALLYSCTGIGANVDITVPKGPKGDPGLSAYDVWKENVNNGTIDWPKGEVDINDFFRFLKGKDGKDGKNGVDGKDGKSAYEVWKEFISTGNADDPHNPGKKWNPNRNTEKDFWMFLAGKDGKDGQDGKDGMSAYDLWKKDLADKCGTADQIMNPHNPSQPWPCDKNTMEDFYKYLRGVDGQSAYALWKEKVLDGTIKWPKDQVGETDFFRYLKGKDGKDGKDGVDGLNGLNAYEVWYQYISSGDVEDPHNPGQKWPANKNTMKDFFVYLTGAKGEKGNPGVDGKSAYELWKEELEKRCGTADPMKNPHKPTENWPCDEKGMEDFLRYLRGMDGASAYEIWKKGVLDGSITGWPTNEVSTADFFRYLKGDKGEKGDKGDNGKDGVNGLSAYEIWKKYIEPGNVPNPHNPTEMWNPNENSEQDFWRFLAGKDGKNGLNGVNGKSAYELWKKQVEENCGNVVTQVMNPHDPTKAWPCNRVTQNDFWDYLRGPKGSDGKDGKDGEPGQAVEIGRPNVLPVFFNGKLREYVDPTDGSVSFQVFDKDGNKVEGGIQVKGIPGLQDQNKIFTTTADGKIKVPKEDLPVNFAPGQRAGKALVDLAKNGVFEETAPNILTPNRIRTRITMEFAYLRQMFNSNWSRSFVNNFTVVLYKYEREVDGRWEEYPEGLPSPETESVKVMNATLPITETNVTLDEAWGASVLSYAPYEKKTGKMHFFYRPVVLTASEKKAKAENKDMSAKPHGAQWLKSQADMNWKYAWDDNKRYMSIRGKVNFYGEAPVMNAAVHVPEIYPVPVVSKNDVKLQIKTGTTSLWGTLAATDSELPEFYLKYADPVNNVWEAVKKPGSDLPQHLHVGIAMTKNWNGGSGSSYMAIKPKYYPSGVKFLLNDSYPGNHVAGYSFVTDIKGAVTLGAADERILHNDFVPYRDSAFYKLVSDSNNLDNPGTIKLVDVYDNSIEIPVEVKNAPDNWVQVK